MEDVPPAPGHREPAPSAVGPPFPSQQHLRLLIESVTEYAIFSTDLQRRVQTWNVGSERLFGFREAEIIGQSADVIFTPEDRARGGPQQEQDGALRTGRAADERWHQRKNGERFYASGVTTPLYDEHGTPIGLVKVTRDLTERKLAAEQLEQARLQLEERVRQRTEELRRANESLQAAMAERLQSEAERHDLLRRLDTAQEAERLRISRELHDEIGQHLAALMLGLNTLEPHVAGTPAAATLPNLQQLTETIGREVHALAVQLRPAVLDDLGLVRAIASYLEVWSERSGIPVDLHAPEAEEPRLPRDVELALYRIVQEALTNIVRHAAATAVSLILNRRAQEVLLIVEDNGRGFDDNAIANGKGGLGIRGMRERAALLQGHFTVESEPGHGTTVFVRLPLT